MIFKILMDFVNSPQFVIDSLNLYSDFDYSSLAESIEDIFFFNADMIAEMQSI